MADYKKSPNAPTKSSIVKQPNPKPPSPKPIPKPKGNPAVPKGRTYKFALPYEIGGMEAMFGAGRLKDAGLFQQLPADIQERLDAAGPFAGGVTVTKQDLDRISTPVLAQIAQMLGLEFP